MLTRPATPADAGSITEIYNQGIEDRIGTFETEPRTVGQVQDWFEATGHLGHYPIVVTEDECRIVAFASTSAYRSRACYGGIAEFSVYVARDCRGRGAGRAALTALIEAAESAGYWKLVSRIFTENDASRRACAAVGFREVGTYVKHAKLDGVWRDVVVVERLIEENLRRIQVWKETPEPFSA
jgi:L-amino acid N-acyltransferase YncA